MGTFHYFIDPVDSVGRCPCAKCGRLPVIAKRSDGKWIGFCSACHLGDGFNGLNPKWFTADKDEAIFNWSARQLFYDVCIKIPEEV